MNPNDARQRACSSRARAHSTAFMRVSRAVLGLAVPAALLVTAVACSTAQHDSASPTDVSTTTAPNANTQPATQAAPKASVNISYSHPGDYLESFTVYKYDGLEPLLTRKLDAKDTTTIVRFNGGVAIWQFQPTHGMFSHLPGLKRDYRVPHVVYGKLPRHFSQTVPDEGPPEPLESGSYYVFVVKRYSGSDSYEALRVLQDGALEGYAARPRAGTSYELCCNLDSAFTQPELSESSLPVGTGF